MTFKKGDPNINRTGKNKGSVSRRHKLSDIERKQLAEAAGGITPLQFAASILRDETETFKNKQWACELLMPYMHRKLPTAIDMTTNAVVTTVSAEDLANLGTDELNELIKMVSTITKEVEVNVEGKK